MFLAGIAFLLLWTISWSVIGGASLEEGEWGCWFTRAVLFVGRLSCTRGRGLVVHAPVRVCGRSGANTDKRPAYALFLCHEKS